MQKTSFSVSERPACLLSRGKKPVPYPCQPGPAAAALRAASSDAAAPPAVQRGKQAERSAETLVGGEVSSLLK